MVEVVIEAETGKYSPDSRQWQAELTDLRRILNREAGRVSLRANESGGGTRGIAETVVLALLSPAAIAGAVACFRAWLSRDKTRTLKLTWSDGQKEQQFILTGENIDQRTLQSLADSIGRTIEGR